MSGDCKNQPIVFYAREMTVTKKILLSKEGVKFAYDIFKTEKNPTREQVVEKLLEYVDKEVKLGTKVNHIMRHTIGLFHGQSGSKTWKQYLSKNMCIRDADLQKVNHIMDQVRKNNPVSLER